MKELFIEKDDLTRFVLTEDNIINEIHYYEESKTVRSKDIFVGLIKNVVPGLNSVFIDLNSRKNAYIYINDKKKLSKYKSGTYITVEVLRDEIGNKGAKVTDDISITDGNFVVKKGNGYSFSKNLNRDLFKKKFKDYYHQEFENIEIIYRSSSLKLNSEEFLKKRDKLINEFLDILNKGETSSSIRRLTENITVLDSIITSNPDIFLIHTNDINIKKYIKEHFNKEAEFIDDDNLLSRYGLEKQIEKLRNRKVSLKDGGNIVIDNTEAMTVIDINSEKTHKENKDSLAFEVNMKALKEIHKQVNLRNISGIILCDFIDMEREDFRNMIFEEAKNLFSIDKTHSSVYPLTELGIMQIARQRKGLPIDVYINLKDKNTRSKLNLNYLVKLCKIELNSYIDSCDIKRYKLIIDPIYQKEFESSKDVILQRIKGINDVTIDVEYKFIEDNFKLTPNIFA